MRPDDLCDTSAVLYQLSYQANWDLVTLWVPNIPVDDEASFRPKVFSGVNFTTAYVLCITALFSHVFIFFICVSCVAVAHCSLNVTLLATFIKQYIHYYQ